MHLLIYLLNVTVNEWDLWKSLCCISSQTFSPGCPRFPARPGSPIFPSQPGDPLPPVSPLSPAKGIICQYKNTPYFRMEYLYGCGYGLLPYCRLQELKTKS